jgi:hypothetical protein
MARSCKYLIKNDRPQDQNIPRIIGSAAVMQYFFNEKFCPTVGVGHLKMTGIIEW